MSMKEVIDPVALGCCLRSCGSQTDEQQAFLEHFEKADTRMRRRMLQRKRQDILHLIPEKESALEQLDYMLHLLR